MKIITKFQSRDYKYTNISSKQTEKKNLLAQQTKNNFSCY